MTIGIYGSLLTDVTAGMRSSLSRLTTLTNGDDESEKREARASQKWTGDAPEAFIRSTCSARIQVLKKPHGAETDSAHADQVRKFHRTSRCGGFDKNHTTQATPPFTVLGSCLRVTPLQPTGHMDYLRRRPIAGTLKRPWSE